MQTKGGSASFGTRANAPAPDLIAWAERQLGRIGPTEISLLRTDYGEIFVIGGEVVDNDSPIHLYLGQQKTRYADSFAEFLARFLTSSAPSFTLQ